jgi:hypothetical protein
VYFKYAGKWVREAFMELIGDSEFSLHGVVRVLEDAYMDVDKSDAGHLAVEVGGSRVLVFYEDEKKMMTLVSMWKIKPNSQQAQLELVNQLNSDLILVRFTAKLDSNILWCDQQILIKGGVSSRWLVHSLKKFGEVCAGAVKFKSEYFE